MNRYPDYQTSSRVALGTAAVALTALAFSLLLVVPAALAPSDTAATADTGNGRLRVEVVGVRDASMGSAPGAALANDGNGRLRVEVIGVRDPSVAAEQARSVQVKQQQESKASLCPVIAQRRVEPETASLSGV